MKLSEFCFNLPVDKVALEPPYKAFTNDDGTVDKIYRRDECRLMVLHRKSRKIDRRQTGDHGAGVFCGLHDCGICRLDTAHGKWSGADRSHEYSHLGNGQCGPGPGLFRSRLFLVSPS